MQKVNIYAFADEASGKVDEQITAMKRNGLNGLEIRNVDGQNVSDISIEKAKEVKEKLDANGLITWSIGSPIGKIHIEKDDFTAHLEKLKNTLEVACVLRAENIRMFSFYLPWGKDAGEYKNEVIDRLGIMCDMAKRCNITLCHENEKGIFGENAVNCLELHKALKDLKGIFDPANYVQSDVDTLEAWALLKDYIYYMHVKDALAGGRVVPAGKGIGNLKAIVGEFIGKGGRDFTIEPHLTIFDGLKQLEHEGGRSDIDEFAYSDSNMAFDVACNSFKELL